MEREMFSARQNWSTVKLGSLTSALARFAVRAGLCSKDTVRLHVYSFVGPCLTVDAEKIRAEIFRRLGRRVLVRFLQPRLSQCPLRSGSDRSAALPRIDGMCQLQTLRASQ